MVPQNGTRRCGVDIDGAGEADGAALLHVHVFRSPDVRLSRYRKQSRNMDKKLGCCLHSPTSCDSGDIYSHNDQSHHVFNNSVHSVITN